MIPEPDHSSDASSDRQGAHDAGAGDKHVLSPAEGPLPYDETSTSRRFRSWFWAFAGAFAVLAVPVFLVTASLRLVVQSPYLYEYGFRTYEAAARTGFDHEQLLSAAAQTRRYFSSDDEPLDVVIDRSGFPTHLYNPREVEHMADVKGLFRLARRVEQLSSGYLLAFLGLGLWVEKRRFLPVALDAAYGGGIACIMLVCLAGIGATLDFERLFLQFHLLSFSNNLWQLDPSRDYLIMMYPAPFFRDATLGIGGLTLLFGALLAAVAGFLRDRLPGPPRQIATSPPPPLPSSGASQ